MDSAIISFTNEIRGMTIFFSLIIKKMKLHQSILRAYDIRGIVGETLREDDAYSIGRAFASYVINKSGKSSPEIAVAFDGRESSPIFADKLSKGIEEAGAKVKTVGIGPTPMLYFAVRSKNLDGGVMITGSHNPPEYNGFKFMLAKEAMFGQEIQELGRIIERESFVSGKGERENINVTEDFLTTLLSAFSSNSTNSKPLKVAWDAGNGAAGDITAALCRKLPGNHILLNEKIDGTFPAHHPDPSEAKNLEQLIDVVMREKCDLGIAFDGDGDRIGAVDDRGRIIWGDQLMILYAKDVLEEKPGATIIADVKASQSLFDEIKRMGGNPIIWKTGHSFIKSKMLETGAALAGEMSGHIFFADKYYGYDDALYAAVRLLNLLAKSGRKFSELVNELPQMHNTPEIRINCPDERKFLVIEEIKLRLTSSGANFSDIDGVRVMTEEGWWLLRASNTQAALVARCEANTLENLVKMKDLLKVSFSESGVDIDI